MKHGDGRIDCDTARERIHARLDGDRLAEAEQEALETHLLGCPACRDAEIDLTGIQRSLRTVAAIPLPDAAFRDVLARTSRAGRRAPWRVWRFEWQAAAAAAVIVVAALFGWSMLDTPTGRPSDAEIERARAEARLVLQFTADALAHSRAAAVQGLTEEISPALQRVPMRLPGAAPAKERNNDT